MTNSNVLMGGDVFVAPKGTNPLRPAGWSKLGHLVSVEKSWEYGDVPRTTLEVQGTQVLVTDPSKDEGEKPPEPPKWRDPGLADCGSGVFPPKLKQPRLISSEPCPETYGMRQRWLIGDDTPPDAFDALKMESLIPPPPPSEHWIVDGFNLVDAVKDRTRGPWEHLGWTTHRDMPEWPEAFDAPKKLDCTPKTYEFTFNLFDDAISPELLKLYYGADYAKYAGEARKKEEQLSTIAEFKSYYGLPIEVATAPSGRAYLTVADGATASVKHDDVPLIAHELFAKSAHAKPEKKWGFYMDGDGFEVDIRDDADAAEILKTAIASLAAYAEWVRGADAREEAKRKAKEEAEKKAKAEEALKAAQDLAKSKGLKVGDKVRGYGDGEGVLQSIHGLDSCGDGNCTVRWTRGWGLDGATLGASLESLTKVDDTPKVGDRVRGKVTQRTGLLVSIGRNWGQDTAQVVWDATDVATQRLQDGVAFKGLEKIEGPEQSAKRDIFAGF